jgi:GTP-dependent phosphoenolpyruvate carboxykinase
MTLFGKGHCKLDMWLIHVILDTWEEEDHNLFVRLNSNNDRELCSTPAIPATLGSTTRSIIVQASPGTKQEFISKTNQNKKSWLKW